MMTVLLFKRVGTLQLSSYGITVITICMLGVYLIIYVYILERLPEHFIFRMNLGSVINIFTVLGLIFVSRLSFKWGDNFLS